MTAVTKGIRSFTTTPFVFTTLDRARAYIGTSANKATYFLVTVAPDADVGSVQEPAAGEPLGRRGADHA